MTLPRRDNAHHTYADYVTWSRNSGDELIDGTAYIKEPPSPTFSHQMVAGEIHRQAKNALKGTPWRVCIAPLDVRLPRSTEADEDVNTVVQPDIFITRNDSNIDARGVRGAPDWIAEVLSRGTANYDRTVKVPMYERAGVSELWLVDPWNRNVTIYRLSEGRYGKPSISSLTGQTPLSVVPEVVIDWEPVVAEIRGADYRR